MPTLYRSKGLASYKITGDDARWISHRVIIDNALRNERYYRTS